MVYIHVKKPILMQLTKENGKLVKKVVTRDSSTSKIYDGYVKKLEGSGATYKKNLNKTGNIYGNKS